MSRSSGFFGNVLTLMAGTTLAQIIPIAISPILTRIYTPEDFGIFALYMSTVSILSSFISGKYELAIVLAENEKEAINIFILAFILTISFSLLLFVIVLFFHDEIIDLLGSPRFSLLLYLLPVTIFMTGLYQVFNYWYTREKEYKKITKNKILQSLSVSGGSISLSFYSSLGLIFGHVIGQIIAIVSYVFFFFKANISLLGYVEKEEIIFYAKKHLDFPKYNMFHSFFNTLSTSFPILILSYFFNSTSVGLYSLAEKILSAPLGIVSGSYSQVFFQEVSSMKDKNVSTEEIGLFFRKTVFRLVIFFLPIAVIFLYVAPDVFSFVFGAEWRRAGVYTQIMIPMLFARFIGRVVSPLVLIFKQQFKGFVFEVINMVGSFFSLLIGILISDFIFGLVLFSLFRTILSTIRLFWYSRIIK